MTLQQRIVDPERIEPELKKIWEELSSVKKTRASLFNLIVVSKLSRRTDSIREITANVVKKFPCRTFFISEDPKNKMETLKTAVSVLFQNIEESSTACDLIDITVGEKEMEKVYFLLLQHLTPDLPIYVLWTEDPSIPHPLFDSLLSLATRMIFDGQSAENLCTFSQNILKLRKKSSLEIADLNWARTRGYRNIIASLFDAPERAKMLPLISDLTVVYNSKEPDQSFQQEGEATYFLAWMMSRLNWKLLKKTEGTSFFFESEVAARISFNSYKELGNGTIVSVDLRTKNGHHFSAKRMKERCHCVKISHSSLEVCELPYEFLLGPTGTGASLIDEIFKKGTSSHYIEMLETLHILDDKNHV